VDQISPGKGFSFRDFIALYKTWIAESKMGYVGMEKPPTTIYIGIICKRHAPRKLLLALPKSNRLSD